MPHHGSLLIFFQRSCFAFVLAFGMATAGTVDGTGKATPGTAAERNFGVVPQLSPIVTAERWQPLLNEISRQTGSTLRFATATSVTTFEERVLHGEYDYVYLNSLLYQQTLKSQGYRALVRDEKPLRGIIVVRHDGPTSLDELAKKTLAFPSPRAFGATLLPRADLRRLNIRHDVSYLGTHESVYQSIAQGRHIAGGGVQRSFDLLPEAQRRNLRILHTTAPAPAHVIAAHARVPLQETERLRQALLGLHENPATARALTQLEMQRLVDVSRADVDLLEGYGFALRPGELMLHAIPRLDAEATRQHMQPLAAYLKQRLDLKMRLKVYSDMATFEKTIYAADMPSLINANPLQALRLIKQGFEVIAQQVPVNSPEGMRSVILVRADSPYRRLEDLKGKRIAFGGAEQTFFSNVMAKAMLRRAGLEGQYVATSPSGPLSNVFPPLLDGHVEAAATGTLALNNQVLRAQYIEGRLRVLAQSEPLPGLPWLVGPRLDPAIRDEIRHFLLDFGADTPGHAAMRIAGVERLVAADNATYNVVRPYLEKTGD